MNRDDIIRIAREAGFVTDEADFIYPPKTPRRGIGLEIERVINLAAAEKDKEIERLQDLLYTQLGELTALRAENQMRGHIKELQEQPR